MDDRRIPRLCRNAGHPRTPAVERTDAAATVTNWVQWTVFVRLRSRFGFGATLWRQVLQIEGRIQRLFDTGCALVTRFKIGGKLNVGRGRCGSGERIVSYGIRGWPFSVSRKRHNPHQRGE